VLQRTTELTPRRRFQLPSTDLAKSLTGNVRQKVFNEFGLVTLTKGVPVKRKSLQKQ
jgi:hypothetical protein